MSNIEGLYSIYIYKKIERSETILRKSAVRYSVFCGSLFRQREVSYKDLAPQLPDTPGPDLTLYESGR
jgi:hypothetical protein